MQPKKLVKMLKSTLGKGGALRRLVNEEEVERIKAQIRAKENGKFEKS